MDFKGKGGRRWSNIEEIDAQANYTILYHNAVGPMMVIGITRPHCDRHILNKQGKLTSMSLMSGNQQHTDVIDAALPRTKQAMAETS